MSAGESPKNPLASLLARHNDGAPDALGELIERLRPWLWAYVRRQMGVGLRAAEGSEDVVQGTLLKIFLELPFQVDTDTHLLKLVATIAVNRLRDLADWVAVRGAPVSSVTHIGRSSTPSREAAEREEEGLLKLGLALLDPADALVIHERNDLGLGFEEIGRRYDIAADAARMRFNRAVTRLGDTIDRLRRGDLEGFAPDIPPFPAE